MKKIKSLMLIVLSLFLMVGVLGCVKPYKTPILKTVEPSQTAYLIPLEGKTSDQAKFMSEEFLEDAKIATKRIEIPQRWLQTGRFDWKGKWIPTMRLIVVERKPVTREWTESSDTGTNTKNEGIKAESKDSISFMARMNCNAQINEEDATKFLYRYNNKSLEQVMDTEIKAMVESKFVEECAKRTLSEIIADKETIMKSVRNEVTKYFKDEKGVTITVLGLKGDFTYDDPEIQKSINNTFKAKKEFEAQKDVNAKIDLMNQTWGQQIKMKELEIEMKKLENQSKAIDKWNGNLPNVSGGSNMLFNIPTK